MNLLFLSNYYTHHQKPVCEAWDRLTGKEFSFLATEEFSQERRQLGWKEQSDVPFVRQYAPLRDEEEICQADYVILGDAPLGAVNRRLKEGSLVFKYSERVYKRGYQAWKWLPRLYRFWKRYGRYSSMYLLSASAYTAADFGIHGTFRGKSYKWGYFPETKRYDVETLLAQKEATRILWCGRFLDWKHPDDAIDVAKRLKDEGYDFRLDIIGTGDLEADLKQMVCDNKLSDRVVFLGSMTAEEVRAHMETAGIYLFTSDFQEGWGAVLNESMNSGCAVVASHAIGSVPFLMKHRENGLIYKNGDLEDFYQKVKYLLDHPLEQKGLGERAYHTIVDLWNAEVAAERFLRFAEEIREHGYCDLYAEGPCSRAEIIRNNWFKG